MPLFIRQAEERMPWKPGKQAPAIRVRNGSSYPVSFSVEQMDSITTHTSIRGVGFGGAGMETATERSVETATDLLNDHRIGPSDGSGTMEHGVLVPFPDGCNALRVRAFFRARGSEEWIPFINKAYPRKSRTIYVITASDVQIAAYAPDHQHEVGCTGHVVSHTCVRLPESSVSTTCFLPSVAHRCPSM